AEELDHPLGGIDPDRIPGTSRRVHPAPDTAREVIAVAELELGFERVVRPRAAAGPELRMATAVIRRRAGRAAPMAGQAERRRRPRAQRLGAEVVAEQGARRKGGWQNKNARGQTSSRDQEFQGT